MANIYFTNYASGSYLKFQNRNNRFICLFVRPKKIYSYTRQSLLAEHAAFFVKNESILSQTRGDGYWLWKPYIIRETLKKIPDGEYLVYYDSGVGLRYCVMSNGKTFINWMNEHDQSFIPGVHIPERGPHHQWCKPSVLQAVLTEEQSGQDISQVQATFSIWCNDVKSRAFVDEWLELAQRQGFIDDSETEEDKLTRSSYIEHRHDQSLLSCLCIKYGIKTINLPNEQILYNKSLSFVELYLKQKKSKFSKMLYLLACYFLAFRGSKKQ